MGAPAGQRRVPEVLVVTAHGSVHRITASTHRVPGFSGTTDKVCTHGPEILLGLHHHEQDDEMIKMQINERRMLLCSLFRTAL